MPPACATGMLKTTTQTGISPRSPADLLRILLLKTDIPSLPFTV